MGAAEVMVTLLLAVTPPAPRPVNLNLVPRAPSPSPALNFALPMPAHTMWRAPWLSQIDPRRWPVANRSGGHGGLHVSGRGHGTCHGGGRR